MDRTRRRKGIALITFRFCLLLHGKETQRGCGKSPRCCLLCHKCTIPNHHWRERSEDQSISFFFNSVLRIRRVSSQITRLLQSRNKATSTLERTRNPAKELVRFPLFLFPPPEKKYRVPFHSTSLRKGFFPFAFVFSYNALGFCRA